MLRDLCIHNNQDCWINGFTVLFRMCEFSVTSALVLIFSIIFRLYFVIWINILISLISDYIVLISYLGQKMLNQSRTSSDRKNSSFDSPRFFNNINGTLMKESSMTTIDSNPDANTSHQQTVDNTVGHILTIPETESEDKLSSKWGTNNHGEGSRDSYYSHSHLGQSLDNDMVSISSSG